MSWILADLAGIPTASCGGKKAGVKIRKGEKKGFPFFPESGGFGDDSGVEMCISMFGYASRIRDREYTIL